MNGPLDTDTIWASLEADPKFQASGPAAARAVLREVVEALPDILAKTLDQKVTVGSLMQAKLDVVEYMLEHGIIEKLVGSMPADAMPVAADELIATIKEMLGYLRTPLMEMIHDTEAVLAQSGLTERELLAHPKGCGLSPRNLAAYDAGTLTLAGLLSTQPAVVLVNES